MLRRFRTHSRGDAFLSGAEFFMNRGHAAQVGTDAVLQQLERTLRLKQEEEARTRAPYLQLALLWQQRCPDSSFMRDESLCEWFALTAEQGAKDEAHFQTVLQWCRQEQQLFTDILQQAPALHQALATGEWSDYFTTLLDESEQGTAACNYLRGAILNAESHTYCHGSSVWHSTARGLLGDMSSALLREDSARFQRQWHDPYQRSEALWASLHLGRQNPAEGRSGMVAVAE